MPNEKEESYDYNDIASTQDPVVKLQCKCLLCVDKTKTLLFWSRSVIAPIYRIFEKYSWLKDDGLSDIEKKILAGALSDYQRMHNQYLYNDQWSLHFPVINRDFSSDRLLGTADFSLPKLGSLNKQGRTELENYVDNTLLSMRDLEYSMLDIMRAAQMIVKDRNIVFPPDTKDYFQSASDQYDIYVKGHQSEEHDRIQQELIQYGYQGAIEVDENPSKKSAKELSVQRLLSSISRNEVLPDEVKTNDQGSAASIFCQILDTDPKD